MDIGQAQTLKRKLDQDITKLVRIFQRETECTVTGFQFEHQLQSTVQEGRYTTWVNTQVKL